MHTKSENTENKILITGGLGFIFSYVTEYFVEKGYEVVVLDNLSEGSHPEILCDTFKHINLNTADPKTIDVIVVEKPDYVIHASAYSDVDVSITSPYRVLSENIQSNINIFEACRMLPNLKKLVYVSTDEVYGECEVKKTESDIIFPKNPYSASKAVGSLLRLAYDNTYPELKDKTAETRFCNVFGPRQDDRKILGRIKKELVDGGDIPVHNEGGGYREYIYVKNIPPVVDLILQKGHRTYNVTTNDGFTVKELIQRVQDVTGRKLATVPAERTGMDMKYQMDATRIKELGWKPLYSFEKGLKEYLYD